MRQDNSFSRGFTLIELLVASFVIIFLSMLILVGSRSSEKRYTLAQAAQKLAADLRRAQNMAMSGVNFAGPQSGYGVYIPVVGATSYQIYAEKDGDYKFSASDAVSETIALPEKVQVKSVNFQPSCPGCQADVLFLSPEPTTYISGNKQAGRSMEITLWIDQDASLTKKIAVTTAGLVSAE